MLRDTSPELLSEETTRSIENHELPPIVNVVVQAIARQNQRLFDNVRDPAFSWGADNDDEPHY